MSVNVLILEFVARRRRFCFFKTKNLFDFREFTSSFNISHNALSRTLNYFNYDMHLFVFFYTIILRRRLTDCIIYNNSMNMFRRQIIALVAKMTIILKYLCIVEY